MIAFLQKQFLPVGLVCVAVMGLSVPEPGIFMASLPTQYVAVSVIFFLCSTENVQFYRIFCCFVSEFAEVFMVTLGA